jgi:hypothetical protein
MRTQISVSRKQSTFERLEPREFDIRVGINKRNC